MLGLFVYGIVGNWPWLVSENMRFQPWELPIIWAPVLIAMLLFLEYGVSRIIGRITFPQAYNFTVKAFVIAAICDCALAGYSVLEDEMGHARAVRTSAEIRSARSRLQQEGHRRYTLTCVFVDQVGAKHQAWFSDVADDIPQPIRQAIDEKRTRATVDVAYDPRWPGRTWLADAPFSQDNRLFMLSLLSLIFTAPLAAGMAMLSKRMPSFPSPRVAPFLATTWILCMAAAIQGW